MVFTHSKQKFIHRKFLVWIFDFVNISDPRQKISKYNFVSRKVKSVEKKDLGSILMVFTHSKPKFIHRKFLVWIFDFVNISDPKEKISKYNFVSRKVKSVE